MVLKWRVWWHKEKQRSVILFSVLFCFVLFFFSCSPVPWCVPVSKGKKTHPFKKQRIRQRIQLPKTEIIIWMQVLLGFEQSSGVATTDVGTSGNSQFYVCLRKAPLIIKSASLLSITVTNLFLTLTIQYPKRYVSKIM